MTYPQALRYLESFVNYEKITAYPYKESLKLQRIRGFLRSIGSPQKGLRCIHIAGTKGKGSTCAFVAYILREAGFKTGLYTSPHLSDFRERIRILSRPSSLPVRQAGVVRRPSREDFEGMISARELAGLVEKFKSRIGRYNKHCQYGPLTFFEVYTALAFVYFKEKKVDFAVLETGLGGRLDATNTVNALVSAITPISYEHTQILGNTLSLIAAEKAGIIKRRPSSVARRPLIVISAPQEKEAADVIRKKCRKEGAKLYTVGRDIKFSASATKRGGPANFFGGRGPSFALRGIAGNYADLRIRLAGSHQISNAAVAIGIIEALAKYGIKISKDAIRRGLYKTAWPGRCEVFTSRPLVVLDGAQNAASAAVLAQAVRDNFKYKRLILMLGISRDKDIPGIIRRLLPLAHRIILTQADNPRSSRPEDLEQAIRGIYPEHGSKIIRTSSVRQAGLQARGIAGAQDLVLVTGSLFMVGEYRNEFRPGK